MFKTDETVPQPIMTGHNSPFFQFPRLVAPMTPVPQRVLFVNLSRTWGGGEQWHYSSALGLRGRGWSVTLLAYPGGARAQRATDAGLAVWPEAIRSTSLLNPFKMLRLTRKMRELRPETVILNASHELKVVGLAARRCGVPQIVLRRGIPVAPRNTPVNRWYLRHVVNRLISNSHATLAAVAAVFPQEVAALNPQVVYNGIDPEAWPPAPETPPPAPETPPPASNTGQGGAIAVVGRLTKEKGVARALDVMARLALTHPSARMRIVGDGSQRAALQAQAEALGISGQVDFVGHSEDVRGELAQCQMLLLPSHWEGFAYVLAEAMLMELPTAAFDIPAASEVTAAGTTGLIVPDGDLQAMADGLGELLSDPERRRRMGQAGRRRALDKFTIQGTLDRLESLLLSS